ncbi:MAG: DUF3795 domain-containing protein [Candidatus Cloacimonadota bacterium]|nr:DUF3795 domain-containing protein [Candidatus Cloacimonadota bacterium]
MITACGVYCEKECHAFGDECQGCNSLKGKVSWAKFIGKETCPIYQCVNDNGFDTCKECKKLPCDIWLKETKNPSMTDKEFKNDISRRMDNLRKYYEI